jgi:hypothetical protein
VSTTLYWAAALIQWGLGDMHTLDGACATAMTPECKFRPRLAQRAQNDVLGASHHAAGVGSNAVGELAKFHVRHVNHVTKLASAGRGYRGDDRDYRRPAARSFRPRGVAPLQSPPESLAVPSIVACVSASTRSKPNVRSPRNKKSPRSGPLFRGVVARTTDTSRTVSVPRAMFAISGRPRRCSRGSPYHPHNKTGIGSACSGAVKSPILQLCRADRPPIGR